MNIQSMNERNQSIFPNYQGNFFNFQKRVGETKFCSNFNHCENLNKIHAGKEGLIFQGLEAAIWKFDKVRGPG